MNVIQLLADEGVNNFGDTRGGGMAGPIGLFIIVLLAIVTVLLIRNMTKRIRRLPAEFPSTGSAETGKSAPPSTD